MSGYGLVNEFNTLVLSNKIQDLPQLNIFGNLLKQDLDHPTFEVWASSTSLTIWLSVVSAPTRVALTRSIPVWLMLPPITEDPVVKKFSESEWKFNCWEAGLYWQSRRRAFI